jgi:hypothetical protein
MIRKSLGEGDVENPNCNDYNKFWIQGSCGQAWEDDVTCPFVGLGFRWVGGGRRLCWPLLLLAMAIELCSCHGCSALLL